MMELKNGSIELKELLPRDAAASDDEEEEFEVNVHGQRWRLLFYFFFHHLAAVNWQYDNFIY